MELMDPEPAIYAAANDVIMRYQEVNEGRIPEFLIMSIPAWIDILNYNYLATGQTLVEQTFCDIPVLLKNCDGIFVAAR